MHGPLGRLSWVAPPLLVLASIAYLTLPRPISRTPANQVDDCRACKCPTQAADNPLGGSTPDRDARTDRGEESTRWSSLPGDGLPVRAPNPWFYLERAYPFGRIPKEAWREAQRQARAMKAAAGGRGVWEFRGPTNVGGRITDLAVDPTNSQIVLAGAAEGGLLRTGDGGQSWTPLFDDQPSLSMGAVALDPTDPQVVYAGTGEVNPGGGSVAYGGAGIFRSTDRGDTWSLLGLENVGSIGRIRVDPTDPQRVYVAAMGDLWEKGPDRGVYRSTDGGVQWQRVLFLSDSTGAVDLVLRPDRPQTLFAVMWERIRRPSDYRYGGLTCGVYRTTDGGDSWSPVGGGLPAPSVNLGRIGLSLCAAQPDVMHAIYADRTGYFAGLYRTTDGGAAWTRTNDGALSNLYASYGWWFGNCRTHPVNPNVIFALGVGFYRSTNGGASWSDASGGMHVDHHALEFGPGASPVIYDGNDGGVYKSTNGGSVWTLLPDQPITQFYRLALDATNPSRIYGGTQDNGTVRTLSGGLADWQMIYGGDGMQPLVHPTNPQRIWAQYQYGSLVYSGNGGVSWSGATGGIGASDRHNWNSPLCFDPADPGRLYFGTQRVYRSTTGTSWSAISPDLTGGPGGGSQGQVYGTLTTIAVSPRDSQVIWAGSDDGRVAVTTDGGASWTDVSDPLPDRWITSVRPSPQTREISCVTLSGFRWGSPLPHVWRTTDLGANWTPIAGNLPEAPVNDLAHDPLDALRLFAATDVGVFETRDGGATWLPLGENLPGVVVNTLALNASNHELFAGTYGRSVFAYDLNQPSAVAGPPVASMTELRLRPNPARGSVRVSWDRALPPSARLEAHDVAGRRVWSIPIPQGTSLAWDLRDGRGERLAAGSYYLTLRDGRRTLGRSTLRVTR